MCYTGVMPRLTPTQAQALSKDELDEQNSSKSPSNQSIKARCPGTVRKGERKGEPCSNAPGAYTDHPGQGYCGRHGGNTPAGKKSAARSYGRQLILEHKERFGGDREDPFVSNITAEGALVEELRRSVAMVRWLEARIGEWQSVSTGENVEVQDGSAPNLPRLVEETSKGAPGATDVQVWLLLYREERKHAAMVAKMCIDANISKRLIDVAETQGKVISRIVSLTLRELHLSEVQASLVPTVVPAVIARANHEFLERLRPQDALDEARALPALPSVYKVTDL